MRILELYDRVAATGVSRVAQTLSVGLRSRGHYVLSLRSGSPDEFSVDCRRCDSPRLLDRALLVGQIRRLAHEHHIDVVHAHQRRLALAAWIAAAGRWPVVEHVHNRFTDRRWTSFRSDRIIALSPLLAKEVLSAYPHTEGNLRVVANGVDPWETTPGPRDATGDVTLLAVGRVDPEKDPETFARLVGDLRQSGVPVRGVWVGAGLLLERMRANFGEYVAWVGEQPDLGGFMSRADAIVSTSTKEAMPLALLEGMAHGLPVIARPAGAIAEMITPEMGILIGDGSWSAWVADIAEFLMDQEIRAHAGEASRQRWSRYYTIDAMVASVERVLEEVVDD